MDHLPLVKMSDLQKKTKRVVEDVKENGYCFVVNRGNPEVVMVSMTFFKNAVDKKSLNKKPETKKYSNKKRRDAISAAFGIWKNDKRSWRQILKELRAPDRGKTDTEFITELLEWQGKNT